MSCGNFCVVVFVGPFCCFAVFLRGETQIWLGDLRVVVCFWFLVFSCFVCLVIATIFDCTVGTTALNSLR